MSTSTPPLSGLKPASAQTQIEEVRRLFSVYLKENGQRHTAERFAVLEEIYAEAGHFDADELFVRLSQKNARVSRATVYNTLELLLDSDLVVKHQFGKAQAKYERAYAYWQHDHLICVDCGEVLEFCDPRLHSIKETMAEIFQFDITHHALHMYGHCQRKTCEHRKDEQAEA
ncbi:MAG: Fur family transcriptional regulator [Bacteroidota bacterium]